MGIMSVGPGEHHKVINLAELPKAARSLKDYATALRCIGSGGTEHRKVLSLIEELEAVVHPVEDPTGL
jgi:hypothetical protein